MNTFNYYIDNIIIIKLIISIYIIFISYIIANSINLRNKNRYISENIICIENKINKIKKKNNIFYNKNLSIIENIQQSLIKFFSNNKDLENLSKDDIDLYDESSIKPILNVIIQNKINNFNYNDFDMKISYNEFFLNKIFVVGFLFSIYKHMLNFKTNFSSSQNNYEDYNEEKITIDISDLNINNVYNDIKSFFILIMKRANDYNHEQYLYKRNLGINTDRRYIDINSINFIKGNTLEEKINFIFNNNEHFFIFNKQKLYNFFFKDNNINYKKINMFSEFIIFLKVLSFLCNTNRMYLFNEINISNDDLIIDNRTIKPIYPDDFLDKLMTLYKKRKLNKREFKALELSASEIDDKTILSLLEQNRNDNKLKFGIHDNDDVYKMNILVNINTINILLTNMHKNKDILLNSLQEIILNLKTFIINSKYINNEQQNLLLNKIKYSHINNRYKIQNIIILITMVIFFILLSIITRNNSIF